MENNNPFTQDKFGFTTYLNTIWDRDYSNDPDIQPTE